MQMRKESTGIRNCEVLIPKVFEDARGFFLEVFRADEFQQVGLPGVFQQWNHSRSCKNVIRGLHFQIDPPMAKLMRVTFGEAFVVAVDIRKGSPTLGRHFATIASADNKKMVYAPAGFARGFAALSDFAEVQYLCTGVYNVKTESGIRWNDPALAISWPVRNPVLSVKDENAQTLDEWLKRPESDAFTY
jgi:dTDP-4-dehydrorhamnose 3,5-epimerase